MKNAIVAVTAVVLLLVPGVLFAQDSCASMMSCEQTLEISDEQCAKLVNLHTEHQMTSIKLGADLKILELKMCQELAKDEPNARELESLVSKIGATKEKLHKDQIDQLLKEKTILGPEQWKIFRRCCGTMGDQCSSGMDCIETGHRGVRGGSPMRMVVAGAGQCGPGNCISMDKNCVSMCNAQMTDGSCREVVMIGSQGCAPGKSSCQTIERRCIQIESGE